MSETEKYVRKYLKEELAKVASSPIAGVPNGLDLYEKTLIYYYTESGYRSINRSLRRSKGKRGTKASELLNAALEKLPDWRGLVHRFTRLTRSEVERYRGSLHSDVPIVEPTFVSASRSSGKGRNYPHSNAEFQIFSLHGKLIEEYSCLGRLTPPNEEEVLFGPGHRFEVVVVNLSDSSVLIKMAELE